MTDLYQPRELDEIFYQDLKDQHFNLVEKNKLNLAIINDLFGLIGVDAEKVKEIFDSHSQETQKKIESYMNNLPQIEQEIVNKLDVLIKTDLSL